MKLVYWALLAVLGALVVFLLSAAARLLRDRRGAQAPARGWPRPGVPSDPDVNVGGARPD